MHTTTHTRTHRPTPKYSSHCSQPLPCLASPCASALGAMSKPAELAEVLWPGDISTARASGNQRQLDRWVILEDVAVKDFADEVVSILLQSLG